MSSSALRSTANNGQLIVDSFALPSLNPFGMITGPIKTIVDSVKEVAGKQCGVTVDSDQYDISHEIVEETEALEAPRSQLVSYYLRLCIYSASDLPNGDPYVQVELGGKVIAKTPTIKNSSMPVWEFMVEAKVDIDGAAPPLVLNVFDENLLADRLLGSASIQLPVKPTKNPKRQQLLLRKVPQGCWVQQKSRLFVSWQLCEEVEGQPDLVQIAEMSSDDVARKDFVISVALQQLKLRKPLKNPAPAAIKFDIIDMSSGKRKDTAISPQKRLMGQSGKYLKCKWHHEDDESDNEAVDAVAGWRCSWTLHESRATLMSFLIHAELQLGEGEGNVSLGASWQEAVSNIQDTIDERSVQAEFWALLTSKAGTPVGRILMEVDVFPSGDGFHASPPAVLHNAALPVHFGDASPDDRGKKIEYFVWAYAHNLPKIGKDKCDPYVRVFMGSTHTESVHKKNEAKDVMWIDQPMRLATTLGISKAKIELWDDNSALYFGSDQLLGESIIYGIRPGNDHWIHLFGGALRPPSDRRDQAMAMTKGAIHPASTYRGSLCLHFNTKPRVNKAHWTKLETARQQRILTVRLYRALYLTEFAGQCVNILIQIPGSELPVYDEKLQGEPCCNDKNSRRTSRRMSFKHTKMMEKANRKEKSTNSDVLCFPGRVSDKGVLRFLPVCKSGSGTDCLSSCRPSKSNSENSEQQSNLENSEQQCSWVERSTPLKAPLEVLPGVYHAYVYVQAHDEERKPPRVFGRILLGGETLPPNRETACRWEELRWDQSVIPLPESHYESSAAGWILGSAMLHYAGHSMGPHLDDEALKPRDIDGIIKNHGLKLPPMPHEDWKVFEPDERSSLPRPKSKCCGCEEQRVGSLGGVVSYSEEPELLQTVYLHIDVLAARNLPAMDEDGLADPGYSVQIEDQQLDGPESLPRSRNPTFMHRACIPIRLQDALIEEKQEKFPLPPVMFTMHEVDPLIEGIASTKTVIGTVVCNDLANLDEVAKRSGKKEGDVDNLHSAVWYLLDGSGYALFDPYAEGGVRKSWRSKPRVLLAMGFSRRGDQTDGFVPLQTDQVQMYNITIDLLGFRNMQPPGNMTSVIKPELQITSYWEEPITLEINDQEIPNPNFQGELPDEAVWEPIKTSVSKAMDIVDCIDDDDLDEADPDEAAGGARTCEVWKVPKVGLDEFLGLRITPPPFRAQVLPYLQKRGKQPPSSVKARLGEKLGSSTKADMDVVLMPDVTFKIQSSFLGFADIGSLSLPLGPFHRSKQPSIYEEILDIKKRSPQLSQRYKDMLPATDVVSRDDVYSVFIDIFAPATGDLLFDSNLRLGRSLLEQRLFKISNCTGPEADDVVTCNFNEDDFMLNNPIFDDEPFDGRVMPCLRVNRDNSSPLETNYLFAEYAKWRQHFSLLHQKPKKKRKLQPGQKPPVPLTPGHGESSVDFGKVKCVRLKSALEIEGWRALSHLHAPSLQDPKDHDFKDHIGAVKEGLKKNSYTFMRDVGHQIVPTDRDSRFLARLQMYVRPEPIGDELPEATKETSNFVIVKFERNFGGTVVWAAPRSVGMFHSAGELLFIVMLDDESRTLVRVTTPNLDIRYPFETAFYPRKTLSMRWRTLEKRIYWRMVAKRKEENKSRKANKSSNESTANLDEDEEDHDAEESGVDKPPDGYSRPIPVLAGEFVLRLTRRPGGECFDRAQTTNWYASTLGEVFPRIKAVADQGRDATRTEFQKASMNLRRQLYHGESQVPTGLLKGHISMQRLCESSGAVANGRECSIEKALCAPIERFWQVDVVQIHVYVLTARQLQFGPSHAGEHADPYLAIDIKGGANASSVNKMGVFKDDNNPNFYEHFALQASLPGAARLSIKVMDKGILSDSLIGEADVDLEDRWMALTHQKITCLTDQAFLEKHMSPSETSEFQQVTQGGHEMVSFRPILAPPAPQPLEVARLTREDSQTGEMLNVGTIRFWIDFVSADGEYQDAAFSTQFIDMELRIIIWDMNNITIWSDIGQRNDLFVVGNLLVKNIKGQTDIRKAETDIHKFAHDHAVFNWRWTFPVRMPACLVALQLKTVDADTFSADDSVYDPQVVPLDHLLTLSYRNALAGLPPLGVDTSLVTFDTWPAGTTTPQVGCCGRRKKPKSPTAATLKMDIQVVSQSFADLNPVGQGRDPPEPLPPPSDRMDWDTAVQDPERFTRILLGPIMWQRVNAVCTFVIVLTITFAILAILFFSSQILGELHNVR